MCLWSAHSLVIVLWIHAFVSLWFVCDLLLLILAISAPAMQTFSLTDPHSQSMMPHIDPALAEVWCHSTWLTCICVCLLLAEGTVDMKVTSAAGPAAAYRQNSIKAKVVKC